MVTLDEIKEKLGESNEETSGDDDRVIARLLFGRGRRRMRLRKLLIAHLIGGNMGDDEDDDEAGERKLIALLLGRRGLRRRSLRRALVAQLIGSRAGFEEDDDDEGSFAESESDADGTLLRLVLGKRAIRRGRLRRLLVAQLLRGGGEELDEDDDDNDDESIFDRFGDRKLAKLLLGRRAWRRSGLRKYAVSELLAN